MLKQVQHDNECEPEDRDGRKWEYTIVGENTFYGMTERGASILEVLEYAKLTSQLVEGRLF